MSVNSPRRRRSAHLATPKRVAAARVIVAADKRLNETTPPWIVDLANTPLGQFQPQPAR